MGLLISLFLLRPSLCGSAMKYLSHSNLVLKLVWPVPLAQVLPRPQLVFPFQNLVFKILFEFSVAEITWNQISPTFWIQILPNFFPLNLAHQDLSNNTPKASSNSSENFSYDLIQFNLQWRNHSIFKNFCTASPNIIMEPSPCTRPRRELSKDTKNKIWSILVQCIS
jgi:hypothetical protein